MDSVTAQALVWQNLAYADGVLVGYPYLGQRAVVRAIGGSSHQRRGNPAFGKGKVCYSQLHWPNTGIFCGCCVHWNIAIQYHIIVPMVLVYLE